MKQIFKSLLILTLPLTLVSGCSSGDDGGVVPSEDRGLWISESEVAALNRVEDDVRNDFSSKESCRYFLVLDEGKYSFEIDAIDIHKSGLITPAVADEVGLFGFDYDLGQINPDGSFSEFDTAFTPLDDTEPSGKPTEIEFLGDGILVFSNFYIGSFGAEQTGLTYYRQTNIDEIEKFNEVLTAFCR